MPIWSLTKERIEKLLKQIGDREAEIDALIKLTKEDLWSADLDAFIKEWRFQLEDGAKTRKKVAQMGRRASSKLKVDGKGPAARKRKAQGEDPDDSDFGNFAVAKKPAVAKRAPAKVGLLSHLSPLAKPKAAHSKAKTQGVKAVSKKSDDIQPSKKASDEDQPPPKSSDVVWTSLDGTSQSKTEAPIAPIFQKTKAAAETKKPAPAKKVESDDEDEEIIRPAMSRRPRAAAKKVPTYNLSDSDSNGDDLLFDVGKMVKGIDNGPADQSSNNRPLFSASMSRPGSNAGLPKKSSSSARQPIDVDGDDTDYSKLAPPQTSKRGTSVTARSILVSDVDMDDDDDDFRARVPSPPPKALKAPRAPKAPAAKATNPKPAAPKATEPKIAPTKAAKGKGPAAAAAAKKTVQSSLQEPKKIPLSPAAKAYAAKKARNVARLPDDDDDDEVEKVANEIMDEGEGSVASDADDDDEDLVVRRPARRAAAQAAVKGKKFWGSESEDEDEEDDESEDFEEDSD